MILQSTVFQGDPCSKQELYLRSRKGKITVGSEQRYVRIDEGEELDTFTYMNLFDAASWGRVSGLSDFICRVMFSGKAVLRLWNVLHEKKTLLAEQRSDSLDMKELQIPFRSLGQGLVFFTIEAESDVVLYSAVYEADYQAEKIHMSLVICTFRRQEALRHIIEVIKRSLFFAPGSSYYGALSVRIVDNGEEMERQNEGLLKVYRNRNEGGSGGFRRGMEECRRDEKEYGITHVILMDDDVDIIPETFYRLYALLSVMKDDYRDSVIAGRMFRKDLPHIQYTAAEIWNNSDIGHVGFQRDMTDIQSLQDINKCNGEYTGWWFGCFPMDYIRNNDPLPFFLHCDDVEYGLRHGGIPLILNGIQVWHETADRRQNPRIDYYDTRNSMIVNNLLGMPEKQIEHRWMDKITRFHVQGEFLSEYMAIRAMEDYLKGKSWLRKVDAGRLNEQLAGKVQKRWTRYMNAVRWRLALRKSRKKAPGFWIDK